MKEKTLNVLIDDDALDRRLKEGKGPPKRQGGAYERVFVEVGN